MQEGTFRPVDPLLTHLSLIGSLLFFFATTPLRQRLIDGLVARRRSRRGRTMMRVS